MLSLLLAGGGLSGAAFAADQLSESPGTSPRAPAGPVVTSTLTAAIPDHSNGGLILPGDTISFSAVVANTGNVAAANAILVPILDSNITLQTATNVSPYTIDQSVGVVPGVPSVITLTAVDGDQDSLSFALVTPPAHGTLGGFAQLTASSVQVSYTANAGYLGTDTFTFKANDGKVDSNEVGVVSIVSAPALAAPTNVVATAANASAIITYTASTSSGITGYTATASPGGATASSSGAATTINFPGLTNGTAYTFTVTATNGIAISTASAATAAVTPAAPSQAPTGVTGTAGNAQVTLTFTPPVSTGGSAITGYTATSSPGGFTGTSAGATPSIVVTGLTNGTPYTFTVTATNSVGPGSPSISSAPVTPITVPGAPTAVVATGVDGGANLTFAAPAATNGSAITGYTATSIPSGVTASSVGTATAIAMTGLTDGISYTFTVAATNAAGLGAASAASNAVVPGAVSGAPTNVAGVAGNQQVTLSFTAPSYLGGSAITQYTATASPGGATAVSSGGSPSIIVTGLTNGTAYTFTVKATNGTGTSAASTASAAVTPATTPGAPTSVVATLSQSIDGRGALDFTAPASSGGSPVTGYTATANPSGQTWSSVGSNPAIQLTGLVDGTTYTFTVAATNAVGVGLTSGASNPVTPTAPSLRAGTSGRRAPAGTAPLLAPAQLAAAVAEARARWKAAGLTADQIKIVDTVAVAAADLPRGKLGQASARAILLSADADGYGWGSAPQMDLVTAVMHEMGHALGLPDTYDAADRGTLMYGVLNAGEQRTPRFNQAAAPGVAPVASGKPDFLLSPDDVVPRGLSIGSIPAGKSVTVTFKGVVAAPLPASVVTLSSSAVVNGGGFASVTSNTVTQSVIASAGVPTGVFAAGGNQAATINFNAPANAGPGAITGYTAVATPGGLQAVSAGTATTIVFSGLTNGVSYTFTVSATNAGGTSAFSAPSNAVIPIASGPGLTAQAITFPAVTGAIIGTPFSLSATTDSGDPVSYVLISGPATLSGNLLTVNGTGPVVVQAVQYGDLTYSAAAPVNQTITATPFVQLAQTITFGGLGPVLTTAGPITLAATASSGLPVSYTVAGPATLSGATLTLTGAAGTVTLTATQAGNATYLAATPVTASFAVTAPIPPATRVGIGAVSGVSNASFAGSFHPDVAISGSVAAIINAANTSGTLIGNIGTAGFIVNLAFDSNGAFTGSTTAITGSASNVAGALTFSGQLNGNVLTGTIAQLGATFSITTDGPTGSSAGLLGYYSAAAVGTTAVRTYTLIGTQGDAYVLVVTPTSVSGGTGTVSANKVVTATTGQGIAVSETINTSTNAVTGSITTNGGTLSLAGLPATTAATNRLINVSFLGNVTAGNPMTSGFVVGGSGSKSVVLRGVGPGLASFSPAPFLAQPQLQVYSGATVLATNAGWGGSAALSAAFVRTGAFALTVGSADAAALLNLTPGNYSAVVTNAGTGAGTGALIEIYDADASPGTAAARLINISNLGLVTAGGSVTAGFIITGNTPEKVLIRGIGPGLTNFGIKGFLVDPKLTLVTTSGAAIAQNDNWGTPVPVTAGQTAASAAEINAADSASGAFPLVSGSTDAALVVTLAPGQYSAQVTGPSGQSGSALVEVYELAP
jgi:hypothetical protein